MLSLEHLQSTDPPWVELVVLKGGQTGDHLPRQIRGYVVVTFEGKNCATRSEILAEFGKMLSFPSYYGRNWDALNECITDMEWMPASGYLIYLTDAHLVLLNDDHNYEIFVSVMKSAGEEWSIPQAGEWPRPAIPFHVLLLVDEKDKSKRKNWNLLEVTL